jgi:hypothetical protein
LSNGPATSSGSHLERVPLLEELPKSNVAVHVQRDHHPTPVPARGLGRFQRVSIEIVPHEGQRYSTVGDWYVEGSTLVIKVSDFEDPRVRWAIGVHELIEALQCMQDGVTQEQVDEWDMGAGADCEDPGMHPSAPYHRQHVYATSVERRLITSLGLSWETYNRLVNQPR